MPFNKTIARNKDKAKVKVQEPKDEAHLKHETTTQVHLLRETVGWERKVKITYHLRHKLG